MPEADTAANTASADDLDLLLAAAREAGVIAMRYFGGNPEVWMKGGVSPVSEADYAADNYLRETLIAARPDHGWLSEETADNPARLRARRTFVVDPIDGTRAFLDGHDTWCVSVAIVEQGESIAGVLECPAIGETYWALPNQGAFRNGERIHVREAGASFEVAGPKPLFDHVPPSWQARIRRGPYIPSLAYRLAMIAGGALDGTFVKPNAHDWDIAAAALILNEAGGKLVNDCGQMPRFAGTEVRHGALAAGSGELIDMMSAALASSGA